MWYSGFRSYSSVDSAYIAYATSTDGITWTKYANNPVLRPGPAAWEYNAIGDVCVIHTGDLYQMWYDASPLTSTNIGRIGRATSTDGIHWTKDSFNNPVLDMGGSDQWDNSALLFPRIFVNSRHYVHVLYLRQIKWRLAQDRFGSLHQRGHSLAEMGTGPILAESSPGSWDQNFVQEGAVLTISDTLHMWYSGMSYSTNRACIGHATMPIDTLN